MFINTNGAKLGKATPAHEIAPAPSTATEALQEERQHANFVATAEEIGNLRKSTSPTLRAAFALRGHRLERAFHGDSKEPTYYAERWGMVRWLPTLHDAVMQFLAQLGGHQ
jgi:hypothetical protein